MGWRGQHCTAGSRQQSAQRTTRVRPFPTEKPRDVVQDPGAGHAGMFRQERACTARTPRSHHLAVSAA